MTEESKPAVFALGKEYKKIDRRRLDAALALWGSGLTVEQCACALRREFGCSIRAARRYVAIVRDALAKATSEQSEQQLESVRAELERKLRAAYEVAAERKDAKGMVAATSKLGELLGALGTQRVEVTGNVAVAAQVAFYVPEETG